MKTITEYADLFSEIIDERQRQNRLHPWDNLDIQMCDSIDRAWHDGRATMDKLENDKNERKGIAFIDRLISEEYHEVFAETDPIKQREELIQLAALCVKVIERIDKEMKDNA